MPKTVKFVCSRDEIPTKGPDFICRPAENIFSWAAAFQAKKISAGKDPMGLAAALHVACVENGESKTQRDVAEAAGLTEVTIRNRYKELLDKLGLEEKLKLKEAEIKAKKKKE